MARLISDLHHLLLVHLSGVNELLYGAGAKEAIDMYVARLAETICTIHSLEIVGGVYNRSELWV